MKRGGIMTWEISQAVINGLLIGGVYAMIAVGLTIIFGVMKIVNFAQGEFMMLGMYVTWLLSTAFGGASPYLLIVPVAFIMFIFGLVLFRFVIRPVVGKGDVSYILLTVGLSFFLQNIAQLIWSADYQSVETTIKSSSISIGDLTIGWPRLLAFGVAILMVFVIDRILKKTDLGRAMRATAENRDVAQMLGVDAMKTFAIAFAIGVVLAGIAGSVLTPLFYVYPRVGTLFSTTAIVVVVLGGLGNVKGAFLGGLIVGLVEAFTGSFISLDLAPVGSFVVLILVLIFKSEGLFGGGARKA